MRRLAGRIAVVVGVLAVAWALLIAVTGGINIMVGGVRFSSNAPWRPGLFGIVMIAIAVWVGGIAGLRSDAKTLSAKVSPVSCAVALSLVTTLVSLGWNSWTASGPDSFAYLSAAALIRSGRLSAPAALATDAPWPHATETFAPFGYRAAPDQRPALVPVIALGLPLMMAAFQTVGGHTAGFLITPLSGGLFVWLTFTLGRRVRSPATGLIAAWLMATSPAFLFMLMWPMTDVPAAALVTLMAGGVLARTPRGAVGSGIAAAIAILTRTTTILAVVGVALWAGASWLLRGRRQAVMWTIFCLGAGAATAAAITAWFNAHLYGAPLSSGYGSAGDLFSSQHLIPNARRYASWLWHSSPWAFAGVAALSIPVSRVWPVRQGRAAAALLGILVVATWLPYLLYQSFEDWWYLRFLLPSFPALSVAAAALFDAVSERRRSLRIVAALGAAVAGIAGLQVAFHRGVFSIGVVERRYVSVARLIDGHTEPNAVILTSQHAGTVRYYSGRETIRYDVMNANSLDEALSWLSTRGRHPYILIEDWELPMFQARFAGSSQVGRLDFPPAVAWQSTRVPGWVWLFDPARRDATTFVPAPAFETGQERRPPPAGHPWPG